MSCALFNTSASFLISGGCNAIDFEYKSSVSQYSFLVLATSTPVVAFLILGCGWIVSFRKGAGHVAQRTSLVAESDTPPPLQPDVDAATIMHHDTTPDHAIDDGFDLISDADNPPSGPGNAAEDPSPLNLHKAKRTRAPEGWYGPSNIIRDTLNRSLFPRLASITRIGPGLNGIATTI